MIKKIIAKDKIKINVKNDILFLTFLVSIKNAFN